MHPPLHPQVAATGDGKGYIDHMKQQRWEYAVIDSPQVNAFVAPGGKVVVYTGGHRGIYSRRGHPPSRSPKNV
jgi:predicted Zn-dependent protease